jgi:flagellar biosynthesis/type III secretory pathway M-ring protein FliF/YscJ
MDTNTLILIILTLFFTGAGIIFALMQSTSVARSDQRPKKPDSVSIRPVKKIPEKNQSAPELTAEERDEMLKSMRAYSKDNPERIAHHIRNMMKK